MEQSMGLHCSNGVCHCDWRVQLKDCVEEKNLRIINIVNIAVLSIAFLLGMMVFVHRIYNGHRIFYSQNSTRWLRPRPVDSMVILLVLFSFFRLLHGICLLADVGRGNWMWRQFIWEFGWQFGYGAITLYFVGITHTMVESHNITGWLPSPVIIDIAGTFIFLSTFVLDIPFCLIAGYYADKDTNLSERFLRIEYRSWFCHCALLASLILFAGGRLIIILKENHRRFDQLAVGPTYHSNFRASILKIELVVAILSISLWCYAAMTLAYSIFRSESLFNTTANYSFCLFWCLGSLTPLCVFLAIVFRLGSHRTPAPGEHPTEESSATLVDARQTTTLEGRVTNNDHIPCTQKPVADDASASTQDTHKSSTRGNDQHSFTSSLELTIYES